MQSVTITTNVVSSNPSHGEVQCCLKIWPCWAVARGPMTIRAHANLCMLCTTCFFKCLNTDFVGSTNTILDICLILLTIYICIPVSGCVGRGPSALLCPGAYNAVKTALARCTRYNIM